MTRLALLSFILVAVLSANLSARAQADEAPPYLYYYSQLLGGIIVDRADGSDSRIIGQHVIPPNMDDLVGPGWSPSGKYFAASRFHFYEYGSSLGQPYLINLKGERLASWMYMIGTTHLLQWSPAGEDILLLAGSFQESPGAFVWLIDANSDTILAEIGLMVGAFLEETSEVIWDTSHKQVSFYTTDDATQQKHTFRVTMHFAGIVLREPVPSQPREVFIPDQKLALTQEAVRYDERQQGRYISPSGRYQTQGLLPAILQDLQTGQQVELPISTQTRDCGHYLWNEDERYLLSLNGCGTLWVGVTDAQGKLWRELTTCVAGVEPLTCANWLPKQVDTDALPPGAPQPVQLDPVRIDYDMKHFNSGINMLAVYHLQLRCTPDHGAHVVFIDTMQTLYTLANVACPYTITPDIPLDHGPDIAVAHDSVHALLAMFIHPDEREPGVSIWTLRDRVYEHILQLYSQGYKLEFTPDGQYLRALNVNGWKVYAVADILAAASPLAS